MQHSTKGQRGVQAAVDRDSFSDPSTGNRRSILVIRSSRNQISHHGNCRRSFRHPPNRSGTAQDLRYASTLATEPNGSRPLPRKGPQFQPGVLCRSASPSTDQMIGRSENRLLDKPLSGLARQASAVDPGSATGTAADRISTEGDAARTACIAAGAQGVAARLQHTAASSVAAAAGDAATILGQLTFGVPAA
jgi:hypothetical protein